MLVYLEAPSAATKLMAALARADPGRADGLCSRLRLLKTGWTPPLREEYFRWFSRPQFQGWRSPLDSCGHERRNGNFIRAETIALTHPRSKAGNEIATELLASRQVVGRTVTELASSWSAAKSAVMSGSAFGEGGASCHRSTMTAQQSVRTYERGWPIQRATCRRMVD
jgi:hypothetical protein